MFRALRIILLLASMMWSPVSIPGEASAANGDSRTVVDDLGFTVRLPSKVLRIVSLVPTHSEMVCLLDCHRLVGGTRYDYAPVELVQRIQDKRIAVIGGGYDANLELIVKLRPDLILTNGPSQQRLALPLKRMGYPVISLWPRDLVGLKKSFTLLGTVLEQQKRAQAILTDMEIAFSKVAASVQQMRRQKVYLQVWAEPLITVGKASFPDWLISAAGSVNVFHDLPFDSGEVSLESIIARDPQLLIFLSDQRHFVDSLTERPGWSSLAAVHNRRFCFIEEADINRSIMFIGGLKKIHRCLSRPSAIP